MLKQAIPNLEEAETTIDSWLANHVQPPARAVGGTLWLTSHRLLFLPNNFENKLAGRSWESLREDVVGAEVVRPQRVQFLAGGLRERLQIATRAGTDLFVVQSPSTVAKKIAREVLRREQ